MKAMVLESLGDLKTDPTPLRLRSLTEPSIASGEVPIRNAIKSKAVTVTGNQGDAERFLSLFSFDDRGSQSRLVEHV